MANGSAWNVVSGMINKKITESRQKALAAKEKEQDTEYQAWAGILNNPASNPEQRAQALENIRKTVPKESHPLVEAWHKAVEAVHGMKKGQPPAKGVGAPATPSTSPAAAQGKPAAGQSPSPLPQTMSDVQSQSQQAAIDQDIKLQKAQAQAKNQAAMEAVDKVREYYKSKGETMPRELEDALVFEAATGKAAPASMTRNNPPAAPKLNWGPSGEFRGISVPQDKENNTPGAEYASRDSIPADRKDLLKMWDDAEKESNKEKEDIVAKENRRDTQQAKMIGDRFADAIKLGDHKAALKVYNDAKKAQRDAVERSRTMDDNLRDINEAKKSGKENQQAMLSMLANHIGMTSGAQPKMRMSKAQWDEAKDSVPLVSRIIAHFDKEGYLDGVTLTPEQMDQMVELAHQKVSHLNDQVEEIKNDPDYEEALSLGKKAVPPSMKSKGKGTSKSNGSTERIVVTPEDMANANR